MGEMTPFGLWWRSDEMYHPGGLAPAPKVESPFRLVEELKRRAPEAYDLWIETTRKRVDHDIWRSRKATRQPYLLASWGQWLGLIAVLAVLVLAGFGAYEGHGVVAGVLGAIDIIGLAAVFKGNQGRAQRQRRNQETEYAPHG
jgi:predicted lipid-binding transport protein (Tim44 family)